MLERLKFIGVGALLADIGRGLGVANRELVARSASPINSLVVKSGTITVSFEMTSSAHRTKEDVSADLPLLGAKTVSYGTQTFEDKQVNRCSISLEIVSVIPTEPGPPTGGKGDDKPTTAAVVTGAAGSGLVGLADDHLAATLAALKKALIEVPVAPDLAASVAVDLDGIGRLVDERHFDEARTALARFAAAYAELITPTE